MELKESSEKRAKILQKSACCDKRTRKTGRFRTRDDEKMYMAEGWQGTEEKTKYYLLI